MQSLCETSLLCDYTENWNRRKSTTVFVNIIATGGGKGTNVVLESGTAHHADTHREQVGSCAATASSGTLGPAPLQPGQLVLQPSLKGAQHEPFMQTHTKLHREAGETKGLHWSLF